MLTRTEKKNLTIFMSVTLSLTIIMSLFIPKCYEINSDAVLFTSIQAYFPMTGVMIVLLYNMRKIKFRLKGFCIVFLFVSGISMCFGVATLFLDYNICMSIENAACRIGSLLSLLLIFYLSDSTDKIRISIKKSTEKEWIGYTFLLLILILATENSESIEKMMVSTVVYLLCFLPFLKSKIFNDSAILDDMFL